MTYDDAERLAAMTAVRLCWFGKGGQIDPGPEVMPARLTPGEVIDLQPGMTLDNLAPGESVETIDPNPRGWHCEHCGGPNPSGILSCVWCGV